MSYLPDVDPACRASTAATVALTIDGRERDLGGGMMVRRILPSPLRRMVGPFIFVDHMGPARFEVDHGVDVRPHPHINLATVTFLFEGEMLHRDSLGTEQVIRPGAVNWMTAGRGIVHSERTPGAARKTGSVLHGMQLWVALPTAVEETDPSFEHHPATTIPLAERPGARLRVIAGEAFGERSPVNVLSPLFYVEAQLERGTELALPDAYAERAAYIVSGALEVDGQTHRANRMVVFEPAAASVKALEPTRALLLGGAPLDGGRHIFWNFVSSSKDRIERAKAEWREGAFPKVPRDDEEFIPLPDE
jgi:redox-sensitive bicupin YhaK (pirin superfamily)